MGAWVTQSAKDLYSAQVTILRCQDRAPGPAPWSAGVCFSPFSAPAPALPLTHTLCVSNK